MVGRGQHSCHLLLSPQKPQPKSVARLLCIGAGLTGPPCNLEDALHTVVMVENGRNGLGGSKAANFKRAANSISNFQMFLKITFFMKGAKS